ncbi:hypothetical protein MMC21_002698 [Puttea exsequens]|nr:hypothetical protein [Puttea exsequens]
MAEYTLGSQRTNSSSSSSSFVSPQTEISNYSFAASGQPFQQPPRDQTYQYQPSNLGSAQPTQSLPPPRPLLPSSVLSQMEQPRYYPQAYGTHDPNFGERTYHPSYAAARPESSSLNAAANYNRLNVGLGAGVAAAAQPSGSVLPPLPTTQAPITPSTLPSSHPLRDPLQTLPNTVMPSFSSDPQLQAGVQSGQESDQRYGTASSYQHQYQPPYQPPYPGREHG